MADIKAIAMGTMDGITITILILIFAALIIFIAYMVWQNKQYKHKVRVREIINGRKIVTDVMAREIKEESGLFYWHLKIFNEKIPLPPPEAVEIGHKGVKCVEVYRTTTGEYIFIKDEGSIQAIPEDILKYHNEEMPKEIMNLPESPEKLVIMKDWIANNTKEGLIAQWKKDNGVIHSYKPLTTNQRMILINQIKKAAEKRKKGLSELIAAAIPYVAVTIIVLSLLIFYEDMGKPLLAMGDKIQQFNKEYTLQEQARTEQLQLIKEMRSDIQSLKADKTGVAPS